MTGGFAQFLIGRGDIQQVVDDLERHAKAISERRERIDLGAGESGHDAADATGRAQQRCRLPVDRGEIGGFGPTEVEGMPKFEDLSLTEASDGGCQQTGHLGAE